MKFDSCRLLPNKSSGFGDLFASFNSSSVKQIEQFFSLSLPLFGFLSCRSFKWIWQRMTMLNMYWFSIKTHVFCVQILEFFLFFPSNKSKKKKQTNHCCWYFLVRLRNMRSTWMRTRKNDGRLGRGKMTTTTTTTTMEWHSAIRKYAHFQIVWRYIKDKWTDDEKNVFVSVLFCLNLLLVLLIRSCWWRLECTVDLEI